MDPQAIRAQLREILEGFTSTTPILYCSEVGLRPAGDLISTRLTRRYSTVDFPDLADTLLLRLKGSTLPLVILVDLFVNGNEPREGVTWSTEDRTNGAVLGVMSVLVMLFRNLELRRLFFEDPARRLVIGTIADQVISIQTGRGESMMHFLMSKMPLEE